MQLWAIELSINADQSLISNQKQILIFFVPMEFPIMFDTVKSGWSIVKIEGLQFYFFISFSDE